MQVRSCKGCEDREPGCHDRCPKYQEEKRINDERKHTIWLARHKENMLNDYAVKSVKRMKGGKK